MPSTVWQYIAERKGKIFRPDRRQTFAVDYRQILRSNLSALMEHGRDTSKTVAKRAYYSAGTKQGKRVSERSIRYILESSGPSPSLDILATIAEAFDLPAWALLLPGLDPNAEPVAGSQAQIEARAIELFTEMVHARRQIKAQDRPGSRSPPVAGQAQAQGKGRHKATASGRKRRRAAAEES